VADTLLDRHVGPDALDVQLAGAAVDPAKLGPVTIRHGRVDVDTQPSAATATLSILAGALDSPPVVGDDLVVDLGADAIAVFGAGVDAVRRFTGKVTDARARLDGRGRAVYAITAAGMRARLGRAFVGDTPWPAELDGARAARILALVDDLVDVGLSLDPGTVQVVARDVDRQAALQLLDDLATDTNAMLVEYRNGTLDWHDADHRRGTTAAASLDASQVLSPAEWAQTLSGMVNDLTVAYGSAEPKAEVRLTDADSIATFGPFTSRIDTQLDDAAAAESFGNLIVARRGRPWWRLDRLDVDLTRSVTPIQAAALLALEQADRLDVTGFPAAGPFVTSRLWVEGWTETITAKAWRLALNVADYTVTGAPVRWVDVPDHVTGADVDPDLTWLRSASWWPGDVDLGRWVDFPSDYTWQDVDPLTTWADLPS
jgi:hypothetical protein